MKSYTLSQILLEGNSVIAATDKSNPANDKQLLKLVGSAGTGAVGALACLKYLDHHFSISSWKSAADTLMGTATEAAVKDGGGMFAFILNDLKSIIGKAISLVAKLADKIAGEGTILSKTIGSSSYTYGTVLCIAAVGAIVGCSVYKIYKVITKKPKPTETAESYYNRITKNLRTVIIESKLMVNGYIKYSLNEAFALPNLVGMGETLIGWIAAPFRIGQMVNNPETITIFDKIGIGIETMWTALKAWSQLYPHFYALVTYSMAFIACWVGIKKLIKFAVRQNAKAQGEFNPRSMSINITQQPVAQKPETPSISVSDEQPTNK